ncbi:MAG: ankyrin repeat domain-containing protein [Proteobacteria bacterium]|nr:MAG: ankyrin repeat domain-containing protein [Pseudomonadota bacterium]
MRIIRIFGFPATCGGKVHRLHEPPMTYDRDTIKQYLICAALNETEMVCDCVDSLGVYPDATWGGKPTALCYAALHANAWLVGFLLERGADADHRDALDMTPLHYGALGGCTESSRLLVAAGACVFRRNRFGKSPSDLLPATLTGERRREMLTLYHGTTSDVRTLYTARIVGAADRA